MFRTSPNSDGVQLWKQQRLAMEAILGISEKYLQDDLPEEDTSYNFVVNLTSVFGEFVQNPTLHASVIARSHICQSIIDRCADLLDL